MVETPGKLHGSRSLAVRRGAAARARYRKRLGGEVRSCDREKRSGSRETAEGFHTHCSRVTRSIPPHRGIGGRKDGKAEGIHPSSRAVPACLEQSRGSC